MTRAKILILKGRPMDAKVGEGGEEEEEEEQGGGRSKGQGIGGRAEEGWGFSSSWGGPWTSRRGRGEKVMWQEASKNPYPHGEPMNAQKERVVRGMKKRDQGEERGIGDKGQWSECGRYEVEVIVIGGRWLVEGSRQKKDFHCQRKNQ